ncbi:hypothetical protein [Vibrio phage vB_VruC_PG21]|uniref:Uncharacterized protein n=1 Tax=Vibrio phage vB_VruC_PG21 TaxID=2928757 RepID=A0AAE9GQE2_9VIRU|nr:hypothetical protein [Vibrio sp. CK2-1]MCF7355069.1 hypothetical protein [Vibrio sp. CK2-1]UOL48293.1 hypothetical protein [Vibrio phage vB_VruC_PG21]
MSLLIEKQIELEKDLGEQLEAVTKSPPFGFKPVIDPLSKLFLLIRVQNQLIRKQSEDIESLKAALNGMGAKA